MSVNPPGWGDWAGPADFGTVEEDMSPALDAAEQVGAPEGHLEEQVNEVAQEFFGELPAAVPQEGEAPQEENIEEQIGAAAAFFQAPIDQEQQDELAAAVINAIEQDVAENGPIEEEDYQAQVFDFRDHHAGPHAGG